MDMPRPAGRPRDRRAADIPRDGCISLRVTTLAPEPLKAVAVAYSTDGRYDNDVWGGGGSPLTVDTRAWTAASPAAGSAGPPIPPPT